MRLGRTPEQKGWPAWSREWKQQCVWTWARALRCGACSCKLYFRQRKASAPGLSFPGRVISKLGYYTKGMSCSRPAFFAFFFSVKFAVTAVVCVELNIFRVGWVCFQSTYQDTVIALPSFWFQSGFRQVLAT